MLAVGDVSYNLAYKVMLTIKANRFLTSFLVHLLFPLEGNTDSYFLFLFFFNTRLANNVNAAVFGRYELTLSPVELSCWY